MPQNEYIERFQKQYGKRLDHDERKRKREAREGHKVSERAQNLRGLRAKLYAESRRKEKIQMKKAIRAKEEKNVKSTAQEPSGVPQPEYLLDRSNTNNAKALSSQIKQKRAEKAAKFSVPLPKVRGLSESEVFSVVKTGKKTHKKAWKRMYGHTSHFCMWDTANILLGLRSQPLLDPISREDQSSTRDLSALWVSDTRRQM